MIFLKITPKWLAVNVKQTQSKPFERPCYHSGLACHPCSVLTKAESQEIVVNLLRYVQTLTENPHSISSEIIQNLNYRRSDC